MSVIQLIVRFFIRKSFFFGVLTICFSCKKLPVYESKEYSKEAYNNEFYDYYDVESKIRYEFYNDSSYFYFKMDTHDRLVKMKILSGGLKIGIDTLGETNLEQYIHYPLSEDIVSSGYEKEDVFKTYKDANAFQDRINNLSKHAIIKSFHGEETIDVREDTSIFKIRIYEDKIRNLVYELRFPIDYFCKSPVGKSMPFSFGIFTGEIDLPEPKNESHSRVYPLANERYNSRAAYRARSNMQSNMRIMRNEIAKGISIWFKVKLQ